MNISRQDFACIIKDALSLKKMSGKSADITEKDLPEAVLFGMPLMTAVDTYIIFHCTPGTKLRDTGERTDWFIKTVVNATKKKKDEHLLEFLRNEINDKYIPTYTTKETRPRSTDKVSIDIDTLNSLLAMAMPKLIRHVPSDVPIRNAELIARGYALDDETLAAMTKALMEMIYEIDKKNLEQISDRTGKSFLVDD